MTSNPTQVGLPRDSDVRYAHYLRTICGGTPWVTRMMLQLLLVSYLLSFLIDLHFSMACIPQFLLHYYEIYRLVTGILVNQSLFSVLLAGLLCCSCFSRFYRVYHCFKEGLSSRWTSRLRLQDHWLQVHRQAEHWVVENDTSMQEQHDFKRWNDPMIPTDERKS